MVRRKYVPPRWVRPPGLHLLKPGDDVLREDHDIHVNDDVDPGDTVTNDDNNVTVITDGDNDNNTMYTTGDGSNVKHGVTVDLPGRSNGHASVPTDRDVDLEQHGKDNGEGEGEEEEEDGGNGEGDGLDGIEVRDIPKMKTRFGGTKHVKVYGAHPTPGTHESIQTPGAHKSILKPTNYKIFQNFISDQLKALNKHSFYARKQAFNIHSQVCDVPHCSICSCAKKVHHLRFNPGNFSKYMYSEYPQITLRNKSKNKTVTFVDNTILEKSKFKRFHLSKKLVEMACEHCVSFTEVNLLCAI